MSKGPRNRNGPWVREFFVKKLLSSSFDENVFKNAEDDGLGGLNPDG
jgi:hypothetical protein